MSLQARFEKHNSGTYRRMFFFIVAFVTVAFFAIPVKAGFTPPANTPFDKILSLPNNLGTAYSYDKGVVICTDRDINGVVQKACDHEYWSSSASGMTYSTFTYTPSTQKISFNTVYRSSYPLYLAWANAVTPDLTFLQVYNNYAFSNRMASDWEAACASIQTSDSSVFMTNTATSETCDGAPPPDCTSYNYSDWGACGEDNLQWRDLIDGNPTGCTIVYPSVVLSQPCLGSTTYNGGTYGLFIVSPQLDQYDHADVQPATEFKVKLRYKVPADKYATTRFDLRQCDTIDYNEEDCTVIQAGTISSIRAGLTDKDNNSNSIFVEVPVVLNEYTMLSAHLVDTVADKVIYGIPFNLKGVNDESLPSENTALLDDGVIQDLGFWGNIFRDLFVPEQGFLSAKFDVISDDFHAQFADFFTLYSSAKNASATTYVDRFSGTMTFSGTNIPFAFTPFENIPSFVPIFTTVIIYLGVGFFLIRNLPEIFSA